MKEREVIKDGVSSTVVIESFSDLLRALGRGSITRRLNNAGGQPWFMDVTTENEDGFEYLSIYIYFLPYRNQSFVPKTVTAAFTASLKNQNPDEDVHKCSEYNTKLKPRGGWGWPAYIELNRVRDENSGFLIGGALHVQVQVRVDVITDKEGIRRLNFHDPFEGCVRFHKKMELGWKLFYVRKALIIHHSPVLAARIADRQKDLEILCNTDPHWYKFELFLQLLHGVRVKVDNVGVVSTIISYAVHLDTPSVIRICERHYRHLFTPYFGIINTLTRAGLPQCHIKRKLSTVESLQELKQLEIEYREHINDTETMKTIVREFFSRSRISIEE